MLDDTGWKCKNCENFNVRTNVCLKCGKGKSFNPSQNVSIQNTHSFGDYQRAKDEQKSTPTPEAIEHYDEQEVF